MNPRILPVDGVIAVYNVALAAAWLRAAPGAPVAAVMVLVHGVAACLPLVLARRPVELPRLLRALREGYPLLVLGAAWTELGWLQEIRRLPPRDGFVERLDLAVFGVHPHQIWAAAQPQAWLNQLMFGLYLSYYLFVFLPPLVLAARGRRAAFRDWTLRLLVTYLGCYVLYTLFPVYGPRFGAPAPAAPADPGAFAHLAAALRSAGDSLGTAFPSSHVAGVVTAAWLSFRWLPRRLAYGFAFGAVGVSLSTVYTRNHYAIDVLAGIAAALALQTTYRLASTFLRRRDLPRSLLRIVRGRVRPGSFRMPDSKGESS